MQKKIFLFLTVLLATFTNAQVVTSKKEALKKGIYEQPADKPTVAPKQIQKTFTATPVRKTRKLRSLINDKEERDIIVDEAENYLALQMINNAMEFIGVSYRGGGTSRAGMDCSGMVTAVFDIFGLKLPRSSNEMAKVGQKLQKEEVKKGDLVFFRTNGRSVINHVGIVVETDGEEIKFIHSSTQRGVIISSTKEPYYNKSFAQVNRVL